MIPGFMKTCYRLCTKLSAAAPSYEETVCTQLILGYVKTQYRVCAQLSAAAPSYEDTVQSLCTHLYITVSRGTIV